MPCLGSRVWHALRGRIGVPGDPVALLRAVAFSDRSGLPCAATYLLRPLYAGP